MTLHSILDKINKFYHLKILKRRYFKYGKCLKCGACCRNIYVRHKDKVIKSEEEFLKLKETEAYSFYHHIKIIDVDDFGVVFECEKFDKVNNLCKNHAKRPSICRKYPSEEIFKMGACLKEDCGYRFEPIEKFEEIYNRVLKKPVKQFNQEN